MQNHPINAMIAAADDAINREDFDALMDFYTEDATLVVVPGRAANGKEEIRRAFVALAEHYQHTLIVTQGDMIVIEAGDTALVIAQTNVRANLNTGAPTMETRNANYVFKRGPNGKWLCIVDNAYGAALLSFSGA
ncbi:MAG: SgcJ/EcaC family oxidoreductase [Pseudomonadota bacterium]